MGEGEKNRKELKKVSMCVRNSMWKGETRHERVSARV